MLITKKQLNTTKMQTCNARKIIYSDGRTAYVFKKDCTTVQNNLTRQNGFPPVNRNEPMTKAAYRRTLNRNFEKLIELDVFNERSLFLTLTIREEQYNTYEKICDRFKVFTNKVRFNKAVGNSYIGAVRFIEVQEKGFFHIHAILVFNTADIRLTWKDLHRMWGWGFVKVKKVYDFSGLIDYLTNNKQGSESVFNGNFTRYPKGAKVIYISPNLPKATSENISITAQECAALVQDENTVGHIKIHKYYDSACRRVRLAVDKMVLIQILKKGGLRK